LKELTRIRNKFNLISCSLLLTENRVVNKAISYSYFHLYFLKEISHCLQVKKTTEAFNNYFNSNGAADGGGGGGGGAGRRWDNADDFSKMPPPKFAPIKKRKSKRPLDYSSSSNSLSSSRSAPTTPTTHSPLKEVNAFAFIL
jgi:hypothetical protein